jgi:hypothetical protein
MSALRMLGKLSNQAALSAWDAGYTLGSVGRAVVMLTWAAHDGDVRELDAWPVGRRDGALLDLRAATFGQSIAGLIACPACAEELDLGFTVTDVRDRRADLIEPLELTIDEPPYRIVFRMPVCGDLQAVAMAADAEQGRRLLAMRCLLICEHDGDAFSDGALPDELIDRMGELMAQHDPQSVIDLSLTCPTCGHVWQAEFDIADFLWREVDVRARRLIRDVHTLALAYGWREDDILAMDDRRRQMYLDLVL